MFRVRCKSCEHLFNVSDDKVGEAIRCPFCKNPIVIRPGVKAAASAVSVGSPAPSAPQASFALQDDEDEAIVLGEKDPPKLQSVSLPHRARRVEAIFVNCRACGQRMQISTRDLDKPIQCDSCKAVMKVELPTVEASLGATVIDENDPLAPVTFDPTGLEDLPTRRSFAKRRAHLRGSASEKIIVAILLLGLLGGLVWMVQYFQKSGPSPLHTQPTTPSPSPAQSAGKSAPAAPVVDTYSWVDSENPGVWDGFAGATWGTNPKAMQNLKPTKAPSELFDAGNMKWYQPVSPPGQIGPANVQSILYAFLQQGDELRLCEIQVQCQTTNDCEELKDWLMKQYGPSAAGQSPFATVEWQGKTSAGKDVLIEIGGKTPSFDGTKVRAAIQGVP